MPSKRLYNSQLQRPQSATVYINSCISYLVMVFEDVYYAGLFFDVVKPDIIHDIDQMK